MSLLPLMFTGADDPFVDVDGQPGLGVAIRVEVALTTAPFATPSWTDISDQVSYLSHTRDRSDGPGGPVSPTQVRVTVENNDGRWNNASPYASAPYAGNVVRDRLVRWSLNNGSGWRVQFLGFLDDVEETVTPYVGQVDLVCSCALRILEETDLQDLARPVELPGQRIDAILSASGLAASFIGPTDNGTVTLKPETLSGSALALCQDVARAELGWFHASITGPVEFRDRYTALDSAYLTSGHTFGDEDIEGDAIVYTQGAFTSQRAVAAEGASGNRERYTSVLLSANWPRTTDDAGTLPLLYDGDVEMWCEARQKWRTSDPPNAARIAEVSAWVLSLNDGGVPGLVDAIWNQRFDLFLAISVVWRPAGWTADHDFNATIEGFTHEIDAREGTWYMALRLSPRFNGWEAQAGNHFYTFGATLTTDHRGSI